MTVRPPGGADQVGRLRLAAQTDPILAPRLNGLPATGSKTGHVSLDVAPRGWILRRVLSMLEEAGAARALSQPGRGWQLLGLRVPLSTTLETITPSNPCSGLPRNASPVLKGRTTTVHSIRSPHRFNLNRAVADAVPNPRARPQSGQAGAPYRTCSAPRRSRSMRPGGIRRAQ